MCLNISKNCDKTGTTVQRHYYFSVLLLHFSLIVWTFVTIGLFLVIIIFIAERGKLDIRGVDGFREKTLAILGIPALTTGLRSVSLQRVRRSLLSHFPQYWSVWSADDRRSFLTVVVTHTVLSLLYRLSGSGGNRCCHRCGHWRCC